MAKNKGKRRNKAQQNRQSSPSKNASSSVSPQVSPLSVKTAEDTKDISSQKPESTTPSTAETEAEIGGIRKVSARVAQFEEAARTESLLNHERHEVPEPLTSPLKQPAALTENAPILGSPMKETAKLSPNEQDQLSEEPTIPQRSVARAVEPESVETFEATRQPVTVGRPVMLENIDTSLSYPSLDVDPDSYFDSPDDVVVTAATMRKIESPDVSQSPLFGNHKFSDDFDLDGAGKGTVPLSSALGQTSVESGTIKQPNDVDTSATDSSSADFVAGTHDSREAAPQLSPKVATEPAKRDEHPTDDDSGNQHEESLPGEVSQNPVESERADGDGRIVNEVRQNGSQDSAVIDPRPVGLGLRSPKYSERRLLSPNHNANTAFEDRLGDVRLPPPTPHSAQSSPGASPRPYKYEQSPLPKPEHARSEPPIIGVCVVGFHHQRGPEVEYWVGPDESQSTMWPYLPFQSLPDGSHQFEENITYFMLLYDRDRHAATSLTFDRDEDGHIRQGTTDFRNVTTLFAVACSRQISAADLTLSEDEEYTRSTVQKSVVVIATKPLFGPIKEKLTVVTRSYFAQQNFGDRAIIDHFYQNLVQMPLWTNENDLHVGMNLQKCVHDFGAQVLVLFKAMLLETKILFYASDTDLLGTTQFALVSLIPNLINHLEDSGSPLLSSYELNLQRPTFVSSSDRQSLLKYMGLPLQLFAGGGTFSPFVPLQQFDDLKQPETQYGMMGTTNKLFMGTDIDFDVVVNVDTHQVVARNAEVGPLLQLTEQDKVFIQAVKKAVDKAWDTDDRWQPQALGYLGGEDYIRHEFEEYLMALLASAKFQQYDGPDQPFAANPLQQYGTAWSERWMRTNNYRISSKNTDKRLFDLVDPIHPGVKLQKPSGIERFFGIFKGSNSKLAEVPRSSSTSVASQTSSNPHTPSLASDEKFAEQQIPTTPSTPRRWFWQSDVRDRPDQTRNTPQPASQGVTDEKSIRENEANEDSQK